VTPQTRKQKSQSMINHCDEHQGDTIRYGQLFIVERGLLLETLALASKGLTTIPVRTPFLREGIRHRIPSNLYYRITVRAIYQNRMISLFFSCVVQVIGRRGLTEW
jgi:hypothetical protein